MRYSSSYKGLQKRPNVSRGTMGSRGVKQMKLWFLVGGFVLLFAGAMFLFRSTKYEKPAEKVVGVIETTKVTEAGILGNPDATMIGVSSQKPVGTAVRTMANNLFHLNMSTTLPGIDRESQYYQAWLVRPVPYDYVSAGELMTDDLGSFVLDWNGLVDKNYSGYTNLVITLQARGGDEGPQGHVAEGEFGE